MKQHDDQHRLRRGADGESDVKNSDIFVLPPVEAETANRPRAAGDDGREAAVTLLSAEQARELQSRWDDIQAGFVDEPRNAVERADSLVADAVQWLSAGFAEGRAQLEGQWKRGDDVSTEDLRQTLRRYRSFFERIVAVQAVEPIDRKGAL